MPKLTTHLNHGDASLFPIFPFTSVHLDANVFHNQASKGGDCEVDRGDCILPHMRLPFLRCVLQGYYIFKIIIFKTIIAPSRQLFCISPDIFLHHFHQGATTQIIPMVHLIWI